jgi:hypothetical protein
MRIDKPLEPCTHEVTEIRFSEEERLHWLAGTAMSGMLGDPKTTTAFHFMSKEDESGEATVEKMIAMASYDLAQEMIKEGRKRGKD